MKRCIACFLLIFSFSSKSTTGNELYDLYEMYQNIDEYSDQSQFYDAGNYTGYVLGVVEFLLLSEAICMSDGVIQRQVLDLVGRELTNYPEMRNEPALIIITQAMISAYPCVDE